MKGLGRRDGGRGHGQVRCSKRVNPRRKIGWVYPQGNILKFNVDGAVSGRTRNAGCGGCRCQILSELLCLFSFWASGPFVASFEFGPRTLSFSFFLFILFEFFESLCVNYLFRVDSSYLFVICR